MRIAREALPFVVPPLFGAFLCAVLGASLTAGLLLFLCLLLLYSFRDPKRDFEGPPELVLAAADGTVTQIDTVQDAALANLSGGDGKALRVVSLATVLDVPLQRCPCEGSVVGGAHSSRAQTAMQGSSDAIDGGYLTVITRREGCSIGVRQLVGSFTRRIVPYLKQGMLVERGDYLGITKFGSRVDLLLPPSYDVLVKVGDRLKGGATPVAMPTDPSTHPLR